jgi:hypothetical protein
LGWEWSGSDGSAPTWVVRKLERGIDEGVPTPILSTALNSCCDEDFYQFDRRKEKHQGWGGVRVRAQAA